MEKITFYTENYVGFLKKLHKYSLKKFQMPIAFFAPRWIRPGSNPN